MINQRYLKILIKMCVLGEFNITQFYTIYKTILNNNLKEQGRCYAYFRRINTMTWVNLEVY